MTAIVFVLTGAVAGALLDGFSGGLFGLAIGVLLWRVRELSHRLEATERFIRSVWREGALTPLASAPQRERPPAVQPRPEPAADARAARTNAGVAPAAPAERTAPAASERVVPPPAPPPITPARPPAAAPAPAPARKATEAAQPPPIAPEGPGNPADWVVAFFTSGNLLVKVGVVILFFGVAFLIRYAAERGLVPIEYRLMGVVAGALVLLGIGWRLRIRRPDYATPVQGGAVGLLYLTIFAAFRIYDLLPASLTFALLLLIVALSAVLAVLQNAVSLAALGTSGGFLAPILASTGGGSHVALFSYYLLLNAGVLGVAWFRSWRILNWLGFVFTFGIGLVWGAQYYEPRFFGTTEPFLIAFFLLYVAVAVLFAQRQPPELRGYIDGTLVFGTPAIAFAMQSALVRDITFGRAYSAVAVSALYLALARMLWRREEVIRPLAEAFLAIGVVFLTLAVPFAFDGPVTAAAWALEGAGLVWIGVRQQRLAARLFGALLQVGAGAIFAAAAAGRPDGALPVLNSQFLGAIAVAVGAVLSARQFDLARPVRRTWEEPIEWVLLVWGLLWWGGAVQREIDAVASFRLYPSVLIMGLAASAALAGVLAHRWAWRALRLATLAVLPLLWFIALVSLIDLSGPWRDLGWIAWPAAVASAVALLRWFDREWPPRVASAWHAGTTWLIAFLLSWTAYSAVDLALPESPNWARTMWAVVPALLVLALIRAGDRIGWPVREFRAVYLLSVPLALMAVALMWVFVACAIEGDPSPLPYVPIANPIEAAQVFVVLAFLRWYRSSEAAPRLGGAAPLALSAVALLAFLAANALVGRVVHFWWNVPYDMDALARSAAFQAGVSILWALTALSAMVLASRRAIRPVWFAGAGLLGLLVLKLFTVDLGNVGGMARIVSFLATGVLILVIGYFSPIPPKASSGEAGRLPV